jgi:hypothetical protein
MGLHRLLGETLNLYNEFFIRRVDIFIKKLDGEGDMLIERNEAVCIILNDSFLEFLHVALTILNHFLLFLNCFLAFLLFALFFCQLKIYLESLFFLLKLSSLSNLHLFLFFGF